MPARGPQRVRICATRWPLHDGIASRHIESLCLATHPPGHLMKRAGESVARWALALAPHARRVQVWCGPGGNGGDGMRAAIALRRVGMQVRLKLAAEPEALKGDTLQAWQAAQAAGLYLDAPGAGAGDADVDLHIDALLGLGTARPQGAVVQAAVQLAQARAPRLAVDLPTGLHAATGSLWDGPSVPARATLSLLTLKTGLFTGHGRDLAGEIWLDDLGAAGMLAEKAGKAAAPQAWVEASSRELLALSERMHAHHKGVYGEVVVVGGAQGMLGALRLAAHASLAAGAGRVYAIALDDAASLHDATRPELMWIGAKALAQHHSLLGKSTVLCGCGAGASLDAGTLSLLISRSARLVLDADALNQLSIDPQAQLLLRARSAQVRPTVLTPHPLEAARLLGCSTEEVQSDRVQAAREIASRFAATVVLKGSGSLIASPEGAVAVNLSGNAALACAGSGDVLAGWISGLWSAAAGGGEMGSPQSVAQAEASPSGSTLAHRVAHAATWLHGHAADRFVQPHSWAAHSPPNAARQAHGAVRALDLVEHMREALLETANQPPAD